MTRYRKHPVRPPEAKSPTEADEGLRRSGALFGGIIVAVALAAILVAGLHHLLRYEFLRTAYVFAVAMIVPFVPMAVILTYIARRRPRAVFTTQVEIPGTNAVRFVNLFIVCAYCAIAAGTMVYGFITRYPVHAFLWATGPATVGYIMAQDRHLGLRTLRTPRQSLTLSPRALTITASPSKGEIRIPWTDNSHLGTSDILGTRILPDPTTGKPPYTVIFDCTATSLTQLNALLDHFNTHPHDRQLLALPEGADLVQTLLDTTPRKPTPRTDHDAVQETPSTPG